MSKMNRIDHKVLKTLKLCNSIDKKDNASVIASKVSVHATFGGRNIVGRRKNGRS